MKYKNDKLFHFLFCSEDTSKNAGEAENVKEGYLMPSVRLNKLDNLEDGGYRYVIAIYFVFPN